MGSSLVTAKGLANVAFEGILFELVLGDGLVFRDTTNVAVRASVVRRIGGKGVCVEGGSGARIDGCDVYDIGNTAIVVSGGDKMKLIHGNHVVDNCHIHHHGRSANSSPGVQLVGCGNRLQHSLVHHTDSQAVTFNGSEHYIGYNVMHDLCEHNWDAGAIYGYMCNRHERGTVIEYNVVHSTGPQPRAGSELMAIYLDAFTSGVTVRGNIVNRTRRGICANGGNDNLYDGNLIINCPQAIFHNCLGPARNDTAQIKRYEFLAIGSVRANARTFSNEVWRAHYPTLLRLLEIKDPCDAIKSRWNVMTRNVTVASGNCGYKNGSLNTETNTVHLGFGKDPGFVDYDGFDWRAKPGSALAKAFPDNRFGQMGLYASKWRVSPPVKHGENMMRPRPLVGEWGWSTPFIEFYRTDVPFSNTRVWVTACTNCSTAGSQIRQQPTSAKTAWTEVTFGFTPRENASVNLTVGGNWGGERVLVDDFRCLKGAELKDGGFEMGYKKEAKSLTERLEDLEEEEQPGGYWSLSERLKDPPWSNQFPPFGIVESVPQNGVEGAIRPFDGKKMVCVTAEHRVHQVVKVKKGVPVVFSYRYISYLPYNQDWK